MANRIDELNSSYLIPGIEVGPSAIDDVSDAEGAEDEVSPNPYSGLLTQTLDTSISGNWQELFGLNRVMPEPNQMEPPSKPALLDDTSASGKEAFFRSMQMNDADLPVAAAQSDAKVLRMVKLMSTSLRTVRGIRARGTEGSYQ